MQVENIHDPSIITYIESTTWNYGPVRNGCERNLISHSHPTSILHHCLVINMPSVLWAQYSTYIVPHWLVRVRRSQRVFFENVSVALVRIRCASVWHVLVVVRAYWTARVTLRTSIWHTYNTIILASTWVCRRSISLARATVAFLLGPK